MCSHSVKKMCERPKSGGEHRGQNQSHVGCAEKLLGEAAFNTRLQRELAT